MKTIQEIFNSLNDMLDKNMSVKELQEIYIQTERFLSRLSCKMRSSKEMLYYEHDFFKDADINSPNTFGQCGEHVYWKVIGDILYIGGEGDMWDFGDGYDKQKLPPWRDIVNFDLVVILHGVTGIGSCAFFDCIFSNIVIPESVKYVGEAAFMNSCIDELVLPETIEVLEDYIIAGDPCQISRLYMSVNILNMNPKTFYTRSGAPKIIYLTGTLPDDITNIMESCFFHWCRYSYMIFYPKNWDSEMPFIKRILQHYPNCDENMIRILKEKVFPL